MHFVKPSWLAHLGEKGNKLPVYSVHIHPDNSRVATGGIDGKIRIWSTKPIIDPNIEEDENEPKQLCALSTHTGVVLCVRFSSNGKYLASGSDDKIVMIWERDMSGVGLGKVFGSNEVNVENWRSVKRLVGHENDVQDLAWSPDHSLLVSVGLDSAVIVWNVHTWEKIRKIESHQSHVKGVTFDPALKYFATSSDDRTIKIWRTSDFALEKSIAEPFKGSPSTTYFRRPSWSPDGSHIAAANAMNGPVSTVVIIDRGTWASEISLIGHESPVEATAFNPRMFRTGMNVDGTQQWVTVIACAGQDRVLSIWNTLNPRPLVITQDIAEKSISDLCWSPDGMHLYMSSYDGSVTVCLFEDNDLGRPLPLEENAGFLARYGHDRHGKLLPQSTAQLELEKRVTEKETEAPAKRIAAVMGTPETPPATNALSSPSRQATQTPKAVPPAPIQTPPSSLSQQVLQQKVTITKEGKKRVAPVLLTSGQSSIARSIPEAALVPSHTVSSNPPLELSAPSVTLPRGGMPTMIVGNRQQHEPDKGEPMDVGESNRAAQANGVMKEPRPVPQVLRPAVVSPATAVAQVRLGVPKVQSFIDYSSPEKSNITMEARNGIGDHNPTKVTLSKGALVLWLDYLPKAVLLMSGNERGYAAACEDGSIITWNRTGRRLLPPIVLEAQPCFLESLGTWLLCITSIGMMHIWNLTTRTAPHAPVSLAPILDSALTNVGDPVNGPSVTHAGITRSGIPIVTLSNGDAYTYSKDMFTWLRLSEAWWAIGSQYWDSSGLKPSGNVNSMVGQIERRTDEEVLKMGRGRFLQRVFKTATLKEGYKNLENVVSVDHLENRLTTSAILNSSAEYRTTLMMYVRRLAEENSQDRLDQLLLDLLGPSYQVPSLAKFRDTSFETNTPGGKGGKWESEVAGLSKHSLLRDVLDVVGKFREFQEMNVQYDAALKMFEDQNGMAMD